MPKSQGKEQSEEIASLILLLAIPQVFAMVGVAGFEPTASWSRTKRATKLRYTPKYNCVLSILALVLLTGLEPVRSRPRGILSPLCLPIPPQQRTQ